MKRSLTILRRYARNQHPLWAIILVGLLGCAEKASREGNYSPNQETAQVRASIDKIPNVVKCRKTRTVWLEASDLCAAIQGMSNRIARIACISHFTNTLARVSVDTGLKNTNDRRVIDAQEDELANYWSFANWGFNLVNSENPDDLTAWDMSIKALSFYKETIKAIDDKESEGNTLCRTTLWHKKNMTITLGGWIRCIELQYSSRRHVMSPAQRATVLQKVKKALGELPPEMAKDDSSFDDD